MSIWRNVADGFALGPEQVIEGDGRAVRLSSMWSDEDGICVAVDAGDEPIPAALAERVAVGMIKLAALPVPQNLSAN